MTTPLPDPEKFHGYYGPEVAYTEKQMLAYAAECVAAETAALRTAIERACKGYPDDATAPTCVAILRAALKEQTP